MHIFLQGHVNFFSICTFIVCKIWSRVVTMWFTKNVEKYKGLTLLCEATLGENPELPVKFSWNYCILEIFLWMFLNNCKQGVIYVTKKNIFSLFKKKYLYIFLFKSRISLYPRFVYYIHLLFCFDTFLQISKKLNIYTSLIFLLDKLIRLFLSQELKFMKLFTSN